MGAGSCAIHWLTEQLVLCFTSVCSYINPSDNCAVPHRHYTRRTGLSPRSSARYLLFRLSLSPKSRESTPQLRRQMATFIRLPKALGRVSTYSCLSFDVFECSRERRPSLLAHIDHYLSRTSPIQLTIPAFPCRSVSRLRTSKKKKEHINVYPVESQQQSLRSSS
ncbi:hypothetical protein AUEXF2481DRAFT_578227 [Aureobasidium subglaciale EXF-2481]|uniref:Uncharacterized protein n=1 Tax=Aureobasidium subglaciale (strain EXF-2481) TaxID=1043005 RepID=A0A074XXC9_AURSE|nr:uncharacterized protein AUEXF2481DRAFT_578227 [Aureobasidium subglaciale EXF-2481]KEQ90233.1 hypothetical protein AUEXF2481DRAFT_578227 [Aureobasidium subglaciale EXF-2481]